MAEKHTDGKLQTESYMSIGVGVVVAIGTTIDDLAMGIAIGVATGTALGAGLSPSKAGKNC